MLNLSQEASLNISDGNDSMTEMKKVTAIPLIKNNDKFKNKVNKDSHGEGKFGTNLSFSQRISSTDPYQISF